MRKRIIALLLALILTVGLLPTVALAADGDTPAAGTSSDVKNGYYEDTTWKEGTLNQGKLPTGVESVSKTAKPTSNPNEYEVTLEVVLKKTESQENPGSAATVLVLDHSGSMNGCAYCKSTTDTRGNYYHTEGCKYDKPNEWVRVTSEQSRMSAATKAVKDFIKTYSGRFDENGQETTIADLNLGRWVCLVWFNKKGGVTGGGDWVDVSNKSGYQMATDTSGWSAHDGTNLDCGLRLADYQLKQNTVAKISKNLKNVIVLSDGEPTFYLSKGVSIKGSIKIGNTKYYVRGSGKDCKKDTYNTTKSTAATLRNSASVYTVCFGASGNEIKDYDKNGNQKITVGNYLKQKIATQPKSGSNEKFAYDAADADALNTAFAAISKTIVSGLSTGTVKDTLPTGISSTVFGEGKTVMNWELNSDAFNKTEETKPLADGTKETVYTYTKTYTVTIDPDNENLVKTEDGYAPLNGETTLTVGSGADAKEIPFPIPAGKVTMPSYTVTFKDGANEAVFKDETQQVEYGKPIPSHADPVRPGYNFTGWTSEPANYQPGTGTMPANNITFTAQWTEKTSVTISYVAKEGGSVNKVSESLNPDTGEATGSTATASTGYTFDGWYSDSECTEAKKVGGQATFIPTKPTTGWVDGTTFYAKFTKNTYTVTYTDGVDGAEVFADDEHNNVAYGDTIPVFTNGTPTREGYNFIGWTSSVTGVTTSSTMPDSDVTFTAGWTPKSKATINYEVVGPANCGSVTPENEEVFVDAEKASGSTATAEPNYRFVGWYSDSECTEANKVSGEVTFTPPKPDEGGWVTTTYYAKFVPSTVTFDLNTLITKTFEKDPTRESKDIPTGTYIFTAQIFEADDTWQQVGEIPVYTGTATLNGAASGAAFDFGSSSNPTLASGTHRYLVKEEHGGETIDGITYDSTVYRLTITVSEDGTQPNVQIEAEPQASVLSVQSVEFTSKIIFTNTYFEEKDPNALYLDFSKYVQKELTATGSKTASDVKFRVIVNGMESPIMMYNAGEEEVSTYVEFNPRYRTVLDVNFASITGGNTETKDFTGSYVEIDQVGIYYFELNEEDGKRTGVTYDDSTYKVYVYVKREGDKLVVDSFDIYKDGWSVAGETITFHNTIDTGRDDYIPIIIPTIINKDTGMLNKTDHFAYVIGYPDGTVHPNGQITRAEVATIFFRLLRDEVRDGAFTTSNSYSDVAYGKWYNNPISTMSALGIITGYPDGTFKPNKPITRAEFAAIAARFDETQSGKSATFSDVIGHWAAKEIGIAYANEWIKGYPDGTFKPDQNITRAEAMTMINRVLERKPESPADLLTNMNKWTDNMDTSKWYYLDVQEATNSHGYTRKTFNYELWRQMLPDPDWSRYER